MCTRWTANGATIFTQEYTQVCLYVSGGLMDITPLWEIPAKIREFDERGEWPPHLILLAF